MSQPQRFSIDGVGVAMIVVLVLVLGPASIFASVWILTHGFEPRQTTTFEWVATVLVSLLALLMIRTGVSELRGGLGVRFDDAGVHRGGLSIAWSEVERVATPSFGVLDIAGAGKSLRLRTYLFSEPQRVIDYVTNKTGLRVYG